MTKNSSPLLVLNMLSTFPGESGTRTAGLPRLNCPDVFRPHANRTQNRCHDPRNFCFSSNVQHFGLLITTPPLESFVPDEPTHEILVHNETADCDLQFSR